MVQRHELRDGLAFIGAFYVRNKPSKAPDWQPFVNELLQPSAPLRLLNRHAAALLVVRVAKHWFAIPFGFGRHLLRDEVIEPGFGLRVTLNAVDADRLRSVDLRTIEEMTMQTRRQASRIAGLEVFGINVTRDIVAGVTGQPRDMSVGTVMTGRDQCVLHGSVPFDQIATRCKQLLGLYDRDDYKERFGWIDHMSAVADDPLRSSLDDALVGALNAGNFDQLHFAAPEQMEWADLAGFRYSCEPVSAALHPDLEPAEYVAAHETRRRAVGPLDAERLRKDKVQMFGGPADAQIVAWQVYRCCVFQTTFAGYLYVLSGGLWYQIEKSFADRVRGEVANIAEFAPQEFGLPPADPGEHEEDYLVRAAPLMEQALELPVVVMDQQMVRAADAASDIEVCDLFTGAKHFIHAKRRTRSSTLSHLFAQGTVSAQAFVNDQTYREGARAKIAQTACGTADFFPSARPIARDYTVVFAVIAKGTGSLGPALPFLSQVNLSYAGRQIRAWGYELALMRIEQL